MDRPADATARFAGFTLLEVLIAFAITALALGVLIDGSITGLRAAGIARDTQDALIRARSRLAAFDRGGLTQGERDGDDGGGFRWRTIVTELATAPDSRTTAARGQPGARAGLYQVSVIVSWKGRSVRLDSERIALLDTP